MCHQRKFLRILRTQNLLFLFLICVYISLHNVQDSIRSMQIDRNIYDNRSVDKMRNYSGINDAQCWPDGKEEISELAECNGNYDLLQEGPFEFLENYKNPCFFQTPSWNEDQLRCLPYFYIIGFPKCGTTDVWDRITLHPDVVVRHQKESHFLDDKRFLEYGRWTFQDYLDFLAPSAEEISKNYVLDENSFQGRHHHLITGEATVNTAAVNDLWRHLPENKGCSEPRFTNADYLKHLQPHVKLIMLLRDPVERLWSDYLYLSQYFDYTTSPEKFHTNFITAIRQYSDCRRYHTARGCAYNISVDSIQTRLRMGMYVTHIKDWLRVFPRNQILVIKTEDYRRKIRSTLLSVFDFLLLPPPPEDVLEQMCSLSSSNVQHKQFTMLPHTRVILTQFYKPFNEELAELLGEDRFLWSRI